jgi:hypothetical protein
MLCRFIVCSTLPIVWALKLQTPQGRATMGWLRPEVLGLGDCDGVQCHPGYGLALQCLGRDGGSGRRGSRSLGRPRASGPWAVCSRSIGSFATARFCRSMSLQGPKRRSFVAFCCPAAIIMPLVFCDLKAKTFPCLNFLFSIYVCGQSGLAIKVARNFAIRFLPHFP